MSDIATKLTYLDTTREKILTETNRLGVGLTEQDKFRDYAKGLHDGYVDILNNGTDTLYDNMEKVSGSGSEITLENTEEAPMKSDLEGDTSQEGTPNPDYPQEIEVVSGRQEIDVVGKNLFNPQKAIIDSNSTDVYITSDNEWIRFKTRKIERIYYYPTNIEENKQYTFKTTFKSATSSTNNVIFYAMYTDGTNSQLINETTTDTNEHTSYGTTTSGKTLSYIMSGNTNAIETFLKIEGTQLEQNTQPTTYEAYTGQSYEINLGNIELCKINTYKDRIFRGSGVNLFDYSTNIIDNANISGGNIMKLVSDNSCKVSYVQCEPNTTYTISRRTPLSTRFAVATTENTPAINEVLLSYDYEFNSDKTSITITTPANAHYIVVRFIYNEITDYETYAKTIQIEEGTTATSYEPYNSKGKWLLHKEIGKVVLDGSESWNIHPTLGGFYPSSNLLSNIVLPSNNTSLPLLMSNYFSASTYSDVWDNNIDFGIGLASNGTNNPRVRNNNINTVNDFKTWLSNNNVPIYYVLATPTTTEITDTELISQLEEWYNQKSNKDVTYISVTSEDLPAILNVIAIKNYE